MPTTQMNIIDEYGDTTIKWDPSSDEDIVAAEMSFKALTKKGYKAFSGKGKKAAEVSTFDPSLTQLTFTPPFKGGMRKRPMPCPS